MSIRNGASLCFLYNREMTIKTHIAANAKEADSILSLQLSEASCEWEIILFLESYDAITAYRKKWADEEYSFGLKVSTLSAWVQDRWAVYGDGRSVVSNTQRQLLIAQAIRDLTKDSEIHSLKSTPGTIATLSSIAHEAVPMLFDDEWISGKQLLLSQAEEELLIVLKRYRQMLSDFDLCEIGDAMAELPERDNHNRTLIAYCLEDLSYVEQEFLRVLGEQSDLIRIKDKMDSPIITEGRSEELIELQSRLFRPNPDNPIKPRGDLRLLMPAGRYAQAFLIAENLMEYFGKGMKRIALSSPTPELLFQQLSTYLHNQGIAARVSGRKTFDATDFGKAWLTLVEFAGSDSYSTFQASDIVMNSLFQVPFRVAHRLDSTWRGERTTDRRKCIDDLCRTNELLAQVVPAIVGGEFIEALTYMEDALKLRIDLSEAYRNEQLSALSSLKSYLDNCEELNVDKELMLSLMKSLPLTFSAATSEDLSNDQSCVDFMTMLDVGSQEVCSYDAVIICDMDELHYPIREKDDAQMRFFSKLGIEAKGANTLREARRNLFRVLSVPHRLLVCERSINTADASPAYSSILLDEIIACYRHDLLSYADDDKVLRIPSLLKEFTKTASENLLYKNGKLSTEEQPGIEYEVHQDYEISCDSARNKVALGMQESAEGAVRKLSLSASAIESYLECPYRWFSLRRLGLSSPDAGFGALEMGSFTHRLLRDFYLKFQKQGETKLRPNTLAEAKGLLSSLFDSHLEMQSSLKKSENPLIPQGSLENAELVSLRKKLLRFLERESSFLQDFQPTYFEYEFGQDNSFTYAGHYLRGSIDRIDVNKKGQAVIVDYKGSLTKDYGLHTFSEIPWASVDRGEDPVMLPQKVQALIYAQAIRQELGLEVVGAIYLSYGRDEKVLGAYSQEILGPGDLLGINPEECALKGGPKAFEAMLDELEQAIAQALECLVEGYIKPNPRGSDPCSYCPVTACESRRLL